MDKRLIYPQNSEKSRDAFFVCEDKRYLQKHASAYHPEVQKYIDSAKPIPNLVQVLLTALGAYEFWGQNVNGDRFKIPALSHKGNDYGYGTFQTNANYFLHHVNKDPSLAKGKVLHAVWNEQAKRVELVVGIDINLDPDAITSIDRGEPLCFSMGCFPKGTLIRMADHSLKPIELISVGDKVLNESAEEDTVTETHVRPYTGDLLKLHVIGEDPIYTTPEHPIMGIRFEDAGGRYRGSGKVPVRTENLMEITPQWIGARHLKPDDFIAIPVNQEVQTPEWATPELMRLFGYYLAEGHVVRNKQKEISGISFATHRDDVIHQEMGWICDKLKSCNPPVTRQTDEKRSDFAYTVELYDSRLAALTYLHCGSYADKKYLSHDVMRMDPELQLELLGAFINGDGWQCEDKAHKDVVMMSTCNEVLAYQVQQILARNGILSTINYIKHSAGGGFNHHETFEFQIYCAVSAANLLAKYSKKVKSTERAGQTCGRRRVCNQWIYTTVKDVSSVPVSGDVYNFEVKNKQSYIVDKIAVHNCKVPYDVCSICANKAKTRAEYCDHLRYQMNQIDPLSGLLVGADNTLPKFFDISRVLIPADKTAYMWEKIASADINPYKGLGSAMLADLPLGKLTDLKYLAEKVAEAKDYVKTSAKKSAMVHKDAAMIKRIPVKTEFDDKVTKAIEAGKALDQKISPSIKKEDLEKIYSESTIEKILSTLSALGIELKPEESQVVLSKETPESLGKVNIRAEAFDPQVAGVLAPYLEARSCARPMLARRIVILAKRLDDGDPVVKQAAEEIRREKKDEKMSPAMMAGLLAAMYALTRERPMGLLSRIGELITAHPYLTVLLGGAAMKAHEKMTEPLESGMISIDPTTEGLYNQNWQSRFAQMQARPVTVIKTGSAKTHDKLLARKLFVGVPSVWLTSKVMKAKQEAEPEKRHGAIARFVANNPEAISYGLIGEHLMGRPVEKRIKRLFDSAHHTIKKASVQDLEFLASVPESEQDIVWDIAILDAAARIRRHLTGG